MRKRDVDNLFFFAGSLRLPRMFLVRGPWRFVFLTRFLIGICIFVLFIGFYSEARAQSFAIQGGNQTLSVTTGSAGSEPIPVVNTATTIRYKRQTVVSKITVRTICSGQSFTLKVLASSVPLGIAAPEVTLVNGMLDTDLITGILNTGSATPVTATLQYTASATFAQGNSTELGNDVHTVTYTILAQ